MVRFFRGKRGGGSLSEIERTKPEDGPFFEPELPTDLADLADTSGPELHGGRFEVAPTEGGGVRLSLGFPEA
jgi:hypothetical protein